jgi:hypothetical protein
VEGYSDPGSANQTVARLMRAGASVSLIEMDEPLWFGHYYTGKSACRSLIENVAERTAVIVKIYTAAFPNVIVGDGEPFPAVSSQPNWAADYAAWTAAFRKATDMPLAFLNLDFNWGDPRLNTGSAHVLAGREVLNENIGKCPDLARREVAGRGARRRGRPPAADNR